MSKTAAIRATVGAVSIARSGRTSYHIFGPYRIDQLSGPSTEITADSWWAARLIATRWRVEVALCLMGIDSETALMAVHWASEHNRVADVHGLIDAAMQHATRSA